MLGHPETGALRLSEASQALSLCVRPQCGLPSVPKQSILPRRSHASHPSYCNPPSPDPVMTYERLTTSYDSLHSPSTNTGERSTVQHSLSSPARRAPTTTTTSKADRMCPDLLVAAPARHQDRRASSTFFYTEHRYRWLLSPTHKSYKSYIGTTPHMLLHTTLCSCNATQTPGCPSSHAPGSDLRYVSTRSRFATGAPRSCNSLWMSLCPSYV